MLLVQNGLNWTEVLNKVAFYLRRFFTYVKDLNIGINVMEDIIICTPLCR